MVDALREARRVLEPHGVLIDLRPLVVPITVDVIVAAETTWTKPVRCYSAPEDVAAADAAVENALSSEWFVFEKRISFDFEIFCDTAAELRDYAEARKLHGEEIPVNELEKRRSELVARGRAPRLRCRRRWMLSTYRKI